MHIINLQLKACSGEPSPLSFLKRARPVSVALGKGCLGLALAGESRWPSFFPQDLKPGNLAVNEDCELKVSLGVESDQSGGGGPFCHPTGLLDPYPRKRDRPQASEAEQLMGPGVRYLL